MSYASSSAQALLLSMSAVILRYLLFAVLLSNVSKFALRALGAMVLTPSWAVNVKQRPHLFTWWAVAVVVLSLLTIVVCLCILLKQQYHVIYESNRSPARRFNTVAFCFGLYIFSLYCFFHSYKLK